MERIVAGVLAHVDSGKTTLSEAILYNAGNLRKLGRVDHGDSFLDSNQMERNRGITIFSKQAILNLFDKEITLLDTPGHVDFSPEMERALQVMDYAILVISGRDGIQSHTETLWKLLGKHDIPVFVFINKMDISERNRVELSEELKEKLGEGFVDFDPCQKQEKFNENIAILDEAVFNRFLETGKIDTKDIRYAIRDRKLFPCYFGSALKLDGVSEFLDGFNKYIMAPKSKKDFGAKVFKIGHDSVGNRLTYMKITGGLLKVRDNISGWDNENIPWSEKISQIRIYSGNKFKTVETVVQGCICAVTGLSKTYPGQGFGIEPKSEPDLMEPVLTYRVELPSDVSPHVAYSQLKILEEEEPKLYIGYDEQLGEIHLQLMGEMQLEVLENIIKERFGFNVSFGPGKILYKESITNKVEGVGHFEPPRHYAEVHLVMEPDERGSGMCFDTSLSEDVLDRNWQNLILSHLEEKNHLGVLTGSPITDIKITLAGGRAHKKHTVGGDFRQATYRAVRQGLMRADNVLLEPWYDFVIEIPPDNVGRAISDIQKMSGTMSVSDTENDHTILKGRAPVAEIRDYQKSLNSYTKGLGRISFTFGGYDVCHNQEKIIAETGYNAESDILNPVDSVFCMGGSSVNVKWNKVSEHMHVESVLNEKNTIHMDREFLKTRAESYTRDMISDKDLMAIFERTYGPVKHGKMKEAKIVKSKIEPIYTSNTTNTSLNFSGPEYLLIDGYNVIYAWPELKELMLSDFGMAREKLTEILCNYSGFMQCELILVFDAYKVKGNSGSIEKINGINVVYTKEAETADMYIEKVTHKLGHKRRVRVVTSDGLEQLIIMGHGALRVSAGEFLEEVKDIENAIKSYLEI